SYAIIEQRTTTCCRCLVSFSSRRKPDGFKGSVELLAEPDVMLIDRGLVLWGWAKGTHDSSKQRFDDLVAQDEVGAHGPNAGRIGLVATRPLDAVDQLFALQFCQIVGGIARGVALEGAVSSLLHGFCHLCQAEAAGPG